MTTELQKTWEERIQDAVKVQEEWRDEFRVALGRDYFEGKQNPGYPEDEWITIPKIYAHLQAQLPSLYSMDPYFYVKLKKSHKKGLGAIIDAVKPELAQQAIQQALAPTEAKGEMRQAMLNYLKGELDLKAKARLGIQDAHFAYGVLKTRHASDTEKHPNAGESIVDDDGNELQDPDTGETQVYPDELPINKRYEGLRIHPDDFVWDADAGPLEDSWGFVAQRIHMRLEEAQKDKRFTSAAKTISPKTKDDGGKKGFFNISWGAKKAAGKKEEFVDIWEIYDLKKNETLTIAEDADDLLIKPRPVAPGVEGHPFSILRFTLRDKSPYPIPPVSPAIDPQKEISLSRSRWMTHRKRFNRKYEVIVGNLTDEAELEKLEVGGDGTIISVRQPAVTPIQDAALDQQGIIELQALDNDVVEALGSPGNARGVANADSATEASILDNRLEVREGDRMSMVVDWITDWAKKLDQLVQFHIEEDEAVKITGPQGEFWQLIKQTDYEEIEGEFEYKVNVGASRPRLPDIERAQLMAFFSQVVIPFPQILTSPATMKKMAELFHIEDDVMIEELRQLAEKMFSGELPLPGGQGGGPSNNPVASVIGKALGQQGGNANGGGNPMVQQ